MPAFTSTTALATLAAIAGTTAVGGGIVAGVSGMKPKKPIIPSILAAPTPTSAEEVARAEVEKMRRIRAMSGGKTILTSEGMGTGGKTLLGS